MSSWYTGDSNIPCHSLIQNTTRKVILSIPDYKFTHFIFFIIFFLNRISKNKPEACANLLNSTVELYFTEDQLKLALRCTLVDRITFTLYKTSSICCLKFPPQGRDYCHFDLYLDCRSIVTKAAVINQSLSLSVYLQVRLISFWQILIFFFSSFRQENIENQAQSTFSN